MDEKEYRDIINILEEKRKAYNSEQEKIFKKKCEEFEINNQLLYKKTKEGRSLRVIKRDEVEAILYMMHTHPIGGHFGMETTYEKIKRRFYWKGMLGDIKRYIQQCDTCQRRGKIGGKSYLNPIKVENAFDRIGIDYVGPLPRTKRGNKYILVVIDYLTKWIEVKALKEATAEATADFIYKGIICRHGCPKIILSDNGTHFKNRLIQQICEKFGIKHKFSSPYHPQTNGLVERFNRTLCESLAKTLEKENQWDEKLEEVSLAYRTNKQATTGKTPFYLLYGREAKLPNEIIEEKVPQQTLKRESELNRQFELIELQDQRKEAQERIMGKQTKQKVRHDRKIRKEEIFQIGDKVLIKEAYKDNQRSGKLSPNWKGPYYIHQVYGKGAYKLKTLDGKILKNTQNIRNLKRYFENFKRDV